MPTAGLELAKIVLELATAAIHSSPDSLHPVWIRLHIQTKSKILTFTEKYKHKYLSLGTEFY